MDHQASPAVSAELNALSRIVVDSIFCVHNELGPGLIESVYEHCLLAEFEHRGVPVAQQVFLPINYRSRRLDAGLRLDLLVDDQLLIELKACEKLLPVHKAQVLTYLKLANLRLGILVNFNVPLIKEGIYRLVR